MAMVWPGGQTMDLGVHFTPARCERGRGPYHRQTMAQPLTTRPDWLTENPPAAKRLTATLAGVSQRACEGEDFRYAVREFIDEFGLGPNNRSRAEAIADSPAPTGDARYDAYLGALAEHLALIHDLERPDWCVEPGRFLHRFWFVSEVPGFHAVSIAQAPAAFRRGGIRP